MAVFGKKLFYSGENGCNLVKWLYSGKIGCFRAKVVVIGQKTVVLKQSGSNRSKDFVFGQKWLISG